MKFIKYFSASYLILFFFFFQIIHASGLFDKYHKINIPPKNTSNALQNKNADFENDNECPLCRFIATISLFVNNDNPVNDENMIFREKDNVKNFLKIEYYSTLNNKDPPIIL